MGKRGPQPEGKLTVIEPATVKRPGPPTGMTPRARNRWRQIIAAYPVDHFRAGDLPLLRAYCEAEALHFKATEMLDDEGAVITVDTQNGKVPRKNPWFEIQKENASTMASLATKLRLCANSRISGKSASKEDAPAKSKRAGLMYGGKA